MVLLWISLSLKCAILQFYQGPHSKLYSTSNNKLFATLLVVIRFHEKQTNETINCTNSQYVFQEQGHSCAVPFKWKSLSNFIHLLIVNSFNLKKNVIQLILHLVKRKRKRMQTADWPFWVTKFGIASKWIRGDI